MPHGRRKGQIWGLTIKYKIVQCMFVFVPPLNDWKIFSELFAFDKVGRELSRKWDCTKIWKGGFTKERSLKREGPNRASTVIMQNNYRNTNEYKIY